MGRLFGTDGVRGVANIEPMTTETAMRLGRAVAIAEETGRTFGDLFVLDHLQRHRAIGRDARQMHLGFFGTQGGRVIAPREQHPFAEGNHVVG